jgi:fibronectin type 3 domain-containing protein
MHRSEGVARAIPDIVRTAGSWKPVGRARPQPAFELENLEPRTLMSTPGFSDMPPAMPDGLAAQIASPTSVKLTWDAADAGVTGFYILRSDNGGAFTKIGTLTVATKSAYLDAKAVANHEYLYKVQAYNTAGASGASDEISVLAPLTGTSTLVAKAMGASSIRLTWLDKDLINTGYDVMRSTDGTSYSVIDTVDSGAATSYIDTDVDSATMYFYKVRGTSAANTSLWSGAVKAATALTTPTGLSADAGANTVGLTWSGVDTHAASVIVMRSRDNITYTAIATLGAGATAYTDATVATASTYYYKVRANLTGRTAGTTAALQVATDILAPTAVTAQVSGIKVNLAWADANRAGMGYIVLRSTDDSSYSQVATIAAGAARKYIDAAVSPDQQYYYRVKAVTGVRVSDSSAAGTVTTPLGTGKITVTTRYGGELVVTAYAKADAISISEDGGTLTITSNGQTISNISMPSSLFIYDRAGSNTITIDDSVSVHTTITALGAGISTITSAIADLSAWIDTTDLFSGGGIVHSIATLAGGVSKAVGASLAKPKDAGTTMKLNASLWGDGPVADDVNQGGVGDCYFLASLAAFAGVDPDMLQESAVDMGDGTYIVQYRRAGSPVFVRVSNDISTGAYWGYKYARPGDSGAIWAPIMEKAFAYFRTGANTYASISSGWMGEVYNALGSSSLSFNLSTSENSFYTMLTNSLNSGKAVTFGTFGGSPNLVGGHAYTLVGVSTDGMGVTHYTVRNPWGVQGTGIENSDGYATLTFAQMQANFQAGARVA